MNCGRCAGSPSARRISPISTLRLASPTKVSGQIRVDQLGFVDDAGTPLDERAQQIEGFRRQVDLLLIAEHLPGGRVDDKVCKAQSHV